MKLDDLIEIASRGYPDDMVAQSYKDGTKGQGDTLALFIWRELRDTFDKTKSDKDQLREAESAIGKAELKLSIVSRELAYARIYRPATDPRD